MPANFLFGGIGAANLFKDQVPLEASISQVNEKGVRSRKIHKLTNLKEWATQNCRFKCTIFKQGAAQTVRYESRS